MIDATDAARAMARARWGTTRLDRLVHDVADRRADLRPVHVAQLRALVEDAEQRINLEDDKR